MARLAELTWQEYERRTGRWLAVLPVGGVQPHGAHLPVNTDTLIAEHLAERLLEQVDGLLLPTVHYGVRANPIRLGGEFPGNVDVGAAAFIEYLAGVLTSAYRDGIRDFLIVFGTYSNGPFIQEAMRRLVESARDARIMAAAWWNLVTEETRNSIAAETGVPRSEDHHSGMVETSLVMHMSPGSVRTDLIDDECSARRVAYLVLPMPADLSTRTGTVFRARAASPEIGRRVTQEVVDALLAAVRLEFPLAC
jgi:creatinine amidohydrolase